MILRNAPSMQLKIAHICILLSLCVAKISLLILGLVGACICVCDRQRGDEKLQIEIVLTYLDITWYMNKKN